MKTVKVKPWGKGQGAFVTINADDYDPATHELLEGERLPVSGGPFDLIAGLAATSADLHPGQDELDAMTAKIAELSATIVERDQALEACRQSISQLAEKVTELTAELEAAATIEPPPAPSEQQQGDGPDYSDEAHARTAKLTVAEIQADLAAMEIEFDPKASKADLLALRNAERQKRGRPLVGDEA